MSSRAHLKPRIKLVNGWWRAIPTFHAWRPNLTKQAEQFCAYLNIEYRQP